ncbi:helix-turn-helix domain-containing protein [Pseudactinotalea sp. Z1748]|uniref:helix-turn-helix domain-containing protein n=1 Tax=Pseudactinotalea sp. Z1748 TaxID=3413027 RepID=UPI003C7D207C
MRDSFGSLVQAAIRDSGLTISQVARRSGVSASTIHRVLASEVSPSIATLVEILAACGQSIPAVTEPLSDPLAPAAARAMLDDYNPGELPISTWQDRLQRWANGEPLEIARQAGEAAGVRLRPGAFYTRKAPTLGHIASTGHTYGEAWAVSGAAGLILPDLTDDCPEPTVVWYQDPSAFTRLLTGRQWYQGPAPAGAALIVVPAEPELHQGSFVHNHVSYAAPMQIVMDSISLGGEVADIALKEASTW